MYIFQEVMGLLFLVLSVLLTRGKKAQQEAVYKLNMQVEEPVHAQVHIDLSSKKKCKAADNGGV